MISCSKKNIEKTDVRIENLQWTRVIDGFTDNLISVGNELYLTKLKEVLKSTDMGNTWTSLAWPADLYPGGMTYSQKNNLLIIGAANNGWYYSSDKGISFKPSGPIVFNTGSADLVTMSNGQIIATQGGPLRGLFKSSGSVPLTWSQKMTGVDFSSITKVTEDTLYACGIGSPAIVKSTDAGETWIPLELNSHALDYILSFQDSLLVVHRWGTISVGSRKNGVDLYNVRKTIAGNMLHLGTYSSKDKVLVVTARENGIYISKDMAMNFKYYSIGGVTFYNKPFVAGEYIFVNTDAGLYRAQFKF